MPGKYKGTGLSTTENIVLGRLASLATLGVDYGKLFHDFTGQANPPEGFTASGPVAPTRVLAGPGRGGVLRTDTGAGAGGQSQIKGFIPLIGPMATDKWAFACKISHPITPTVNSRQAWGFYNAALGATVMVGALGGVNATKYICQYNGNFGGSSIDLGVAFDQNIQHVLAMWHPGDGKIYASIDWGSGLGGVTFSGSPSEGLIWGEDYNSGVAQQLQRDTDWIAAVFPRN
jgi:hypothetical protein